MTGSGERAVIIIIITICKYDSTAELGDGEMGRWGDGLNVACDAD